MADPGICHGGAILGGWSLGDRARPCWGGCGRGLPLPQERITPEIIFSYLVAPRCILECRIQGQIQDFAKGGRKQWPLSLPPTLTRGSGGITPGTFLKFYFAVGEF